MTQATPFWSISLYECEADEDDELQFDEDAIIKVTNAEDPDWWYGSYEGQVGMFPSQYVEVLEPGDPRIPAAAPPPKARPPRPTTVSAPPPVEPEPTPAPVSEPEPELPPAPTNEGGQVTAPTGGGSPGKVKIAGDVLNLLQGGGGIPLPGMGPPPGHPAARRPPATSGPSSGSASNRNRQPPTTSTLAPTPLAMAGGPSHGGGGSGGNSSAGGDLIVDASSAIASSSAPPPEADDQGEVVATLILQLNVVFSVTGAVNTVDLSPFTTVEAAFEAVIEAFDIVQPDKHALYANGVAMEDHKTLLAYRLRSGDTIEIGFKRDVSELKVVLSGTGSGGGADRVVRLRFDQDTLVGTAVDMIRSAAGLGDEGSGLYFVEECLWLDAGERLSSYDLLSEEMVEFRERPVIDARDMGRALILKITVELDSQAASMGGTTKMRFYAHTTVAEALRMIGTRYPVKSMREYGLFIPEQRGTEAYWLERSATIASYDLTHHTDIVYKRMLKPFTIAFPSGERELFRVGDDTLVGDMMEAIRDIFPVPDIGVYGLFLPLPHPIPLMKLHETLWSYKSLKDGEVIELRLKDQPVVVAMDTEEIEDQFEVSFASLVQDIVPIVCRRFGLRSPTDWVLLREDGAFLAYEHSLLEYGLEPGCKLRLAPLPPELLHKKAPAEEEDPDYVHLWDEPEADETNVIYNDGVTAAGGLPEFEATTLNKLVERLTHAEVNDSQFFATFLLTYESFCSSEELFRKLVERWKVPRPEGMPLTQFKKSMLQPIQIRVVNAMKSWLLDFPDFSDELKEQVKYFISVTMPEDSRYGPACKLWRVLAQDNSKSKRRAAQHVGEQPKPILPRRMTDNLTIWDFDEEEIARQMCLIEFELYANIKPRELLNQHWAKEKYHHRAPNLLKLINRFNEIATWIQYEIVSTERVRDRVTRMQQTIKLADHLFRLNNFSSTMAIISGLSAAATLRLKFTREGLKRSARRRLEELEEQMSAESSYSNYRNILSQADPPCVPYIGVYLKDLTFIDDGNEDYLHNLINYGKRKMAQDQIAKIQLYQSTRYSFERVPILHEAMAHLPHMAESELYNMSLEREPRGSEKNQIV